MFVVSCSLSFLYPLFLAAPRRIAIPIALHLFRRRTETVVDFPAVRLLHKAPVEQQRRRRLRELILLALRVDARWRCWRLRLRGRTSRVDRGACASPITIVALDTSMSLSAPGQFDAARQAARAAVDDAPATHRVGLVTFADAATLVVPPTTRSRRRARRRSTPPRRAPAARASAPRSAARRKPSARATAASSSSPTCSRPDGKRRTKAPCRTASRSRSSRCAPPDGQSRGHRGPARGPGRCCRRAQFRRAARARAGAPASRRTRARRRERVDVAPQSAAEVRFDARRLPPRGGVRGQHRRRRAAIRPTTRAIFVLDPPAAVPVIVLTADPPGRRTRASMSSARLASPTTAGAFARRVRSTAVQFSALDGRRARRSRRRMIVLGTRTLDRKGREAVAAFLRERRARAADAGPDVDLDTLHDTLGVDLGIDARGGAGRAAARSRSSRSTRAIPSSVPS